jgi:hypothetical protein
MIANPRYGVVGMLALPFFVLFEFLGAFVETLGYVSLAVSLALGVNVPFALLFMLIAVLSGVLLSLPVVVRGFFAYLRGDKAWARSSASASPASSTPPSRARPSAPSPPSGPSRRPSPGGPRGRSGRPARG